MNYYRKIFHVIRWITRVISLLVALVFVAFFIGEGLFNNISKLTIPEILGVVCIEIGFEMFIIFGILFIICGMIDKLQLDKKI